MEAVRAALLALDDEQLQRVIARTITFTQQDEQVRKLLGYHVRPVARDTRYATVAELLAAEADVPFTFAVPSIDALRARFASQPAHQLVPIFKAMSNQVPMIKNASWQQRLQVELPTLANTPSALPPPPVVNPAFDAALVDDALRQTIQSHRKALTQALIATVRDIFRTATKFQVDHRGNLHNTGMAFILEDYATVDDFLEEWDGAAGHLEQLSERIGSTIMEELTRLLAQALTWLERENPTYYAELLAFVAYHGSGLLPDDDKAVVAGEILMTDIIGDALIEYEAEIYDWIADRPLADLLRDVDLPVTQSRAKMAASPPMQALLQEFEGYCYSTAILTLTTLAEPEPLALDLHREGATVTYGYAPEHKDLLMARLLSGTGGLILRSFLDEQAPQSTVPIKELRGWAINSADGALVAQRIPADDLYWAMNTDSQTGQRLPPEPDVRYC